MKTKVISMLIVTSTVLTSLACKKQNTATPSSTIPANEVLIQSFAFSPASITVAVNTTVKWTNKDGVAHTVTSNSSLFDSGNISSGGTYSHKFTSAGTFPYHCTIHSSMTGTVVVQ